MKNSIYQDEQTKIYSFEITQYSISNTIAKFYSIPSETLGAFLIRIAPELDLIIETVKKKELSEELKNWCKENYFCFLSADELFDEIESIATEEQKKYLKSYIERWNSIN